VPRNGSFATAQETERQARAGALRAPHQQVTEVAADDDVTARFAGTVMPHLEDACASYAPSRGRLPTMAGLDALRVRNAAFCGLRKNRQADLVAPRTPRANDARSRNVS
jgi:hypothetical protein